MSAKTRLQVVLFWHMHQPEYRDVRTGVYQLPWTYLHATKDYVDMAAHLEANEHAHAVVNFAPVLLDQLDDYAVQITAFLQNGTALRDPLLAALGGPTLPHEQEERIKLIHDCMRANEERLIKRFPAFHRLVEFAKQILEQRDMLAYISEQFLADLLVWYHLAWMGETIRREDPLIRLLLDKKSGYTLHDRRSLVEIIGNLVRSIVPRYRKLSEAGQVELAMSPYAHPIVPLLLDIKCAQESMPAARLPILEAYPGGQERALWHINKGIETFKKHFGVKPRGCWPSEGSVSKATIKLLGECGFDWIASGGSVLHNSLGKAKMSGQTCIHTPYKLKSASPSCFFRDDGLSDLIGFTYSTWHADDAVANLIHNLETIADACNDQGVVSIILDGENAWEYYPENGYYFLNALYRELSKHPRLQLNTYSNILSSKPETTLLPELVAGSWVYGTFSTWIGEQEKNRGWDMLGDAKHAFDRVRNSGKLDPEHLRRAEFQLAICEGSDWFWWFGDYNPAESVSSFEHLYRLNLSNLYQLLGEEPPEYLSHSFTHGTGAPAMGGVMRPGQETK